MGLSGESTGSGVLNACDGILRVEKKSREDRVIALAGNPNVGKSTVFNSLTGLNQHTGNWPGKTVANAQGRYRYQERDYILVDIPGTYSLSANSEEEEIARDFICFGEPDATVVVADATCLERNLNFVLQTMEVSGHVVLCVNLLDEAKKKKIRVKLDVLSRELGIPVVGTCARSGKGLKNLMEAVSAALRNGGPQPPPVDYGPEVEKAVSVLEPAVKSALGGKLNARWVSLRLLDGEAGILAAIEKYLGFDLLSCGDVAERLKKANRELAEAGLQGEALRDRIVTGIVKRCERIAREAVVCEGSGYSERDWRIDRILTSKATGIPIMILLLCGIFWLTITGANYPSELLADGLFWVEDRLAEAFAAAGAPLWLKGLLVDGCYRTLAWVISVMLPPMAIFFPLFTLLEDSGYLPRIAFNMDDFFRRACAHGKQSLTMCMGFGCNACGVIGCRIIDSPRERLIAILTNNFVPCNGRFPTLIAIITMFFAGLAAAPFQSVVSSLMLTAVIVFGVVMTLASSRLLSKTVLKGMPSSFHLELPPFRRPQIGQVIVRSILDRTLFVLRRAAVIAAPTGLVIWLLANVQAGDRSLLTVCADFLDPFARLCGLDGYILMAFLLGFPANEIVVPILIMSYTASGSLTGYAGFAELHTLLLSHGWTWLTAVCMMLFCLMHWPCGTTCLTIHKETQSAKWTAAAFALPTVSGLAICMLVTAVARLLGLA
jgi:ferrous iron transport protein B